MSNYITTLRNKDGSDGLLPRTVLKAIADDNGDYLDNTLIASDINALKNHSLGSPIDISSYTETNYYITPSDGYVMAHTTTDLYARVSIRIENIDMAQARCWVSGYSGFAALYVKKGTKISRSSTDSVNEFKFYPLT